MKKVLSITLLAVVLIFVSGQNNFARAYDSISFINATGRTIYYVYFVPSHYESWGSDRLSGVWHSGDTLTLDSSYWRYWSFKIVFEGGESLWWTGAQSIDAQEIYRGTITPIGNGQYTMINN